MNKIDADSKQSRLEEGLVGACELALLEAAWQYFLARPTIGNYLFVIDAPTITKVHSLPVNAISQFGLTYFLNAPNQPENLKSKNAIQEQRFFADQAKEFPLTVGLTEIVSRYLFDRRWSGDRPKIMSTAQLNTLANILGGLERNASKEMSMTLRNIDSGNALKDIVTRWQKSKSKDPQDFINSVILELEQALPALYGTYNHTRQLLRLTDILPFNSDADTTEAKLAYLHEYVEIEEILDFKSEYWKDSKRNPIEELNTCIDKWHVAIPPPGIDRDAENPEGEDNLNDTRLENAKVLGQIEFVNREFRRTGQDIRLVFITTTGRLFESAVKRFGCPSKNQSVKYGPLSRFDKAYYTHKLLAEVVDPDLIDKEYLSDVPFFDPRILLCHPDFVSYAAYDKETDIDEQTRSISKWLSLFFSNKFQGGMRENTNLLFNTYQYWQANKKQGKVTEKFLDPHRDFQLDAFQEVANSWDMYVRLVAAAGGLGRVVNHQMMQDVLIMLKASDNPAKAFKEIVSNRLNTTMSDWLAASGKKAIYEWELGQHTHLNSRTMPPLIMPVFGGAQESFENLAYLTNDKCLPQSTLDLLRDPDLPSIGIPIDDEYALLKARYIQMIVLAALFYKMNKWDAAQILTAQAYALAEQLLSKQDQNNEVRFISGREAAYFASVCLRRTTFSLRYAAMLANDGYEWCNRYERSTHLEKLNASLTSERYRLHNVRSKIEKITWDAIKVVAYSSQANSRSDLIGLASSLLRNVQQLKSELDALGVELKSAKWGDTVSRNCYETALVYLNRQLALVSLQTSIFVPNCHLDIEYHSFISRQAGILNEISSLPANSNHISILHDGIEMLLLDVAKKISVKSAPPIAPMPAISDNEPYILWRDNALKKILEEK